MFYLYTKASVALLILFYLLFVFHLQVQTGEAGNSGEIEKHGV